MQRGAKGKGADFISAPFHFSNDVRRVYFGCGTVRR